MVGAVGAVGVLDKLAGRNEPLVRAVPALVRADVQVPVGVGAANHLVDGPLVVLVRRADEPVGADLECVLRGLEERDHLVDEMLGILALLGRGECDVDRVLVRAREEARVVALHPPVTGDRIGADHLVERVQTRPVVRVGDGRGQIIRCFFGHNHKLNSTILRLAHG